MKSEKAKEYITHATCTAQEYAERFGGRELVVSRWDVSTAIELAEQDAEMRMREKAIKAYCSECACYETGACALDPDKCATKLLFVQNMTDWIDPKDFMPEANKNVLVKCSSGEIQTDFYAPELGGFFIEHSTHAKVTGWREMM